MRAPQFRGEINDTCYPKTHLKGYKMSIKDFRKNILLKTRGNKNNKSDASITQSPRKIKTEANTITSRQNMKQLISHSRLRQIYDTKHNHYIEEVRRLGDSINESF